MERNLENFLNAVKDNKELKKELYEATKHYSDKNVVEDFSLEEQVNFICDVIVPFADKHGFKISLADIVLGDSEDLNFPSIEDVSGGLGLNKKLLASTFLALQTLTSVVPSNTFAANNNSQALSSASTISSGVRENQVSYDTIVNILKKCGKSMQHISEESPFNEVDGMVLSTIAYLPLNCVPSINSDSEYKNITISEWSKFFTEYYNNFDNSLDFHKEDLHKVQQYINLKKNNNMDSVTKGRTELLQFAAKCPRYKNIKIGNFSGKYVAYKEKCKFCEQFAAVTYTLEDGTKVVSFRGTDSTLAGWKEDLDLSWSKTIPAQEDALKYLEKVFADYPDSKYIVTGHSKGGNLAQYAAFVLSSKNKNFMECLLRIFNYDGPGINKDTISAMGNDFFEEVSKKLVSYIPQSSTIGRILSDVSKGKYVCVYSNVTSASDIFGQHDSLTWNVAQDYEKIGQKAKFRSYHVQESSDFAARATSAFMRNVDRENAMKFFVQWLFDFIVKNDISIQGDQSLQDMCGSVFYNYFIKNKSYREIINGLFHPGKVLSVDDEESKKFKNVATAAYKSLLSAYWERHVEINRGIGVPPETTKIIEDMVNSGCSFDKMWKLVTVTVDKALTWQNVKSLLKRLYS